MSFLRSIPGGTAAIGADMSKYLPSASSKFEYTWADAGRMSERYGDESSAQSVTLHRPSDGGA